MAKLRQYEIKAIVQEVHSKLRENDKNNPVRESTDYIQFKESLLNSVAQIDEEIEILKNKRERLSEKKRKILNSPGFVYGREYEMYAEREADKIFGIKETPSISKIERCVILSDLEGNENIIETAIKKLQENE